MVNFEFPENSLKLKIISEAQRNNAFDKKKL